MAKKKLFLAQAMYEEHWLIWADDEDTALDTYWTDGKKVLEDMPWFEMNEIDPEDAEKRYSGEVPKND